MEKMSFSKEQAFYTTVLASIAIFMCPAEDLGDALAEGKDDNFMNKMFVGLDTIKKFVDEMPGVNEPGDYVKVLKELIDARADELKEGGDE